MKRYLILSGDKTTASGTVEARPTTVQLNGVHVAHEGDDVACPACNSQSTPGRGCPASTLLLRQVTAG